MDSLMSVPTVYKGYVYKPQQFKKHICYHHDNCVAHAVCLLLFYNDWNIILLEMLKFLHFLRLPSGFWGALDTEAGLV